jgi:rhodanese-related sulfurtransferase
VARLLLERGYPENGVAVLAGGITGWEKAGYPVVRAPDST